MRQITLPQKCPLFLLVLSSLLLASTCSLLEEGSCQFTRSEVSEWQRGYTYIFHWDDEYEKLQYIALGAKGVMVQLNDICVDKPLTVSAELTLSNREDLGLIYSRAYLLFRHKTGNSFSFLRSVKLAQTSLGGEDIKLEVKNFEYTSLPLLYPEGIPGSLAFSILIPIDVPCKESDVNTINEWWLDNFFKSAKITVGYTVR
ncbi:MAG: hypothetical protein KDC66_04355 [Phaeodactylibacter sp.]|nr:hypothetical protein [Phaeodactylibacter sp.]MCB9273981.1 hypothetical protein [Lewinellaceae bacterium]